MDLVGYYRGTEDDLLRARITEYADKHGMKLVLVLYDPEGGYGAFRQLQNLIKSRECGGVLLPSYSHLGEDRYVRLENELFLKRNGAKIVCMAPEKKDRRHGIIVAAKRFSSYVTDWDADYGIELPYVDRGRPFKRTPPIGYEIKDGEAVVSPKEAEAVRLVFDSYAMGKTIAEICHEHEDGGYGLKLGNMTVKTILRNERYLGRQSQKGYRLEPIITYALWLKARERLERDYETEKPLEPYFTRLRADKPCSLIRSDGERSLGFKKVSGGPGCLIDLDALEAAADKLIMRYASMPEAEKCIWEYTQNELAEARRAYPEAVMENNRLLAEFNQKLRMLVSGDRSDALQSELENLADLKSIYGMRVRRIRSEEELFSISREEISTFLERARKVKAVSREEKAFIASAFCLGVEITDNEAFAFIASPFDGRLKRCRIDNSKFC